MFGNHFAFPENDDVREYYIKRGMYNDREPDHHTEGLGEVELQHERADTELEGGHRGQVESLSEPEVLQILRSIIWRDGRVPDMLAGSDPCGHVAKTPSNESACLAHSQIMCANNV